MNELDVVKLIRPFKGLEVGIKGTIVHKYNSHNFEVEFFDQNNESIDVFTIESSYLELVWKFNEIK